MDKDRALRIAIECRIEDSRQGIGTAVVALAKALSDTMVADQEYTFIVREDMTEWLAPYVYGPCRLVGIPSPKLSNLKKIIGRFAPLRFIWFKFRGFMEHVPVSDGYVESQQFDVVHFPTQMAYLTDLPSIYQPWDLQHRHYPEFFDDSEFISRERYFRAFFDRASYVCVQTEWTKQDVIQQYGLPADKIVVIPWGSVFDAYRVPSAEVMNDTRRKFDLPCNYFFYPAATWPHKNHEIIFHALRSLSREHGIAPQVYFTGSSTKHRHALDKLALDLGVHEQVHFLGFVTPEELQSVYGAATAMIFPSKFEGFGLPIFEAFHARLPIVCSSASTLPEVARDAALYFDPNSPEDLAYQMNAVLNSPELRHTLMKRGTRLLSQYSMSNVAASFRDLYCRTARFS